MPRGGARVPGEGKAIGRPKTKPELPAAADRKTATLVLDSLADGKFKHAPKCEHKEKCECVCLCEICQWRYLLLFSADSRLRFDTLKYLTDRRDGKAVHTVNHLHDKPIDLNVNISMADIVRKVRERKEQYERGR